MSQATSDAEAQRAREPDVQVNVNFEEKFLRRPSRKKQVGTSGEFSRKLQFAKAPERDLPETKQPEIAPSEQVIDARPALPEPVAPTPLAAPTPEPQSPAPASEQEIAPPSHAYPAPTHQMVAPPPYPPMRPSSTVYKRPSHAPKSRSASSPDIAASLREHIKITPPTQRASPYRTYAVLGVALLAGAFLLPSLFAPGPNRLILPKEERFVGVRPFEQSPEELAVVGTPIAEPTQSETEFVSGTRRNPQPEPQPNTPSVGSDAPLVAKLQTTQSEPAIPEISLAQLDQQGIFEGEKNSDPLVADVDEMLTQAKQPPRPQRLAAPSMTSEKAFAPSVAVAVPPDPNRPPVDLENPFVAPPNAPERAELTLTLRDPHAVTQKPASTLHPAPQTDFAATASPQADPPPQHVPQVFTEIARLAQVEARLLEIKPPLANQPVSASIALPAAPEDPERRVDLAFEAPSRGSEQQLVAAIDLTRLETPQDAQQIGAARLDPIDPVATRVAFAKPVNEARNSDLAIDPDVSIPAKRPKVQPGEGPLKVLSQNWITELGHVVEETPQGVLLLEPRLQAVASGVLLSQIDGAPVATTEMFLDQINAACEPAPKARIELELILDGKTSAYPLRCAHRILLSNAIVLEARYSRRKWKTNVLEAAKFGTSNLQVGDVLVIDYASQTKLDTPHAFRRILAAARAAGKSSIEFGLIRGGVIESAELGL